MEHAHDTSAIESDALAANLRETAWQVKIDPTLLPLVDIVEGYQGLSTKITELLREISHPFRNWQLIIPELRAYTLKNLKIYLRHEQGPEAFGLFTRVLLDAIAQSQRSEQLLNQAMEAMLAYTDKFVRALDGKGLVRYEEELNRFFERLARLDDFGDRVMMSMVQGYHPVKKIAAAVVARREAGTFDLAPLARLLHKTLKLNYEYWLDEVDPLPWFLAQCDESFADRKGLEMLEAISHSRIRAVDKTRAAIDLKADPQAGLETLLELPAHVDMVRLYRDVPAQLMQAVTAGADPYLLENYKLLFLFRIMETRGLYLIHEETLREINRSLVQLIRKQSFEEIKKFFITALHLLKINVRHYPHTSLQCIQVIGDEVFKRSNSRLVETFLWEVVRFGFQYANVSGIDEDWQPIANPAHLSNLRVWLHLIEQEPKWCSTLFSALIINIKLTGTCVRDTDLFQRDITELLNHPIGPIYNLAKQFTKQMPVFFNEIGAEGELREVSTELDEVHRRQDRLIHFLRKQSHVESSNLIVGFIEAIYTYWLTLEKEGLREFIPEEVVRQVTDSGPFVDELHRLVVRINAELQFDRMQQLLNWNDKDLAEYLAAQQDIAAHERRRFDLLVKMYKLLHQKYSLGVTELRGHVQQAVRNGFPGLDGLLDVLDRGDTFQSLEALLERLEYLKEIILSEEQFEPREEIYYKRHIAVDIPSVYGRYSERKFDALGLTFRLEGLTRIYLERLGEKVKLSFITQVTFIRIVQCMRLFLRALKLDGISSRRLETFNSLLASSIGMRRFTYTQRLDIMRGLSEGIKDAIYAYYTNIHQKNLSIIIPQIGKENLLPRFHSQWNKDSVPETVLRLSEVFFRDLIADALGLQHLDTFIARVIRTLEAQKELLDEATLGLLMTYNPEKAVSSMIHENPDTHNLIHLGNKGFNLMVLHADGKRVPPAFIITTEVFRCYPAIKRLDDARSEFLRRVRLNISTLEKVTDSVFGSPVQPLLLSVRSGSAMSMPGMMSTIYNVGLNEELVNEYVADNPAYAYFAWDNFRRFIQSWGMAHGMGRDAFQVIMDDHKKRYGVRLKREFSPEQMHELALRYGETVAEQGFDFPDDPWLQLITSMEVVLDSWYTPKASEYRRLMDVSDDWGTAVIVQHMVYGNLSQEAGSGVAFTAHPYRKVRRVALWGDYATGDQGEDIVSGLVISWPLSVEQAEIDGRDVDKTLERRFPEVYAYLLEMSRDLVYEKGWNPQEIEFTFEGPRADQVYLLQTRDMITIKKREHLDVFIDQAEVQARILARGIGVSGSALGGLAVFTEKNISELRASQPQTPLILFRQDTVPEDIREIAQADGLVTSRGGQTSHAAVVATRLGKTCVVGCRDLAVYENEECAEIAGQKICFGDAVSIDGRNGLLVNGLHATREEVHILPL
ncbi:MAG: phosphoenolpyruvate synthase [Deltaproteobacteria bacterium]|nr:MAG: phosphoenolpyruvate synthase [Deltaproteobacteria bacterium]